MNLYFCDNEWATRKAFHLKQTLFFHQNSGVWFYIQDFQFLLKLGSGKLSSKVLHNFDMGKYLITVRLYINVNFSSYNLILEIILVNAKQNASNKSCNIHLWGNILLDVKILLRWRLVVLILHYWGLSSPLQLIVLLDIQIVSLHQNKSKWND